MRTISLIISLSIINVVFGQRLDSYESPGGNEFKIWTYNEFIQNNFKKVSAYFYVLTPKGERTSDSVLLYQESVILDSNAVVGIKCSNYDLRSENQTYSWDKIKLVFNKNNSVVKYLEYPKNSTTTISNTKREYFIPITEYLYEYDDSNRIIKETYNEYGSKHTISSPNDDTLHMLSLESEFIEYCYDSSGHKIKVYFTDGSFHYLKTNSYAPKTDWGYDRPRYLNTQWFYGANGLVEKQINNGDFDNLHSKSYFFYDDSDRLIKQIDSTGWSYPVNPPNVDKMYDYLYKDSTKIVTQSYNSNIKDLYSVSEYDKNGKILSKCDYYETKKSCTVYAYKYKNDKLAYKKRTDPEGYTYEVYLEYNSLGLLIEKKEFLNGIIRIWKKYYFE